MSSLTRLVGVLTAGAALLVPAATAGSNLLANGTFDSSTSGWTTQSATLGTAKDGLGGTNAALVSVAGSPTTYSIAAVASSSTTKGVHYLANAYERSDSRGDDLCLLIEESTTSGKAVGSSNSCVSSKKSWQPFPQVEYVAAASGDVLDVRLLGSQPSRRASFEADSVTLSAQQPVSGPPATGGSICGTMSSPPQHYDHVVWIWMENRGYDQIVGAPGSSVAQRSPYVNGTLVPRCGLATNYHNVTHPSLPNYIAATSGSAQGLTSDHLQHYSVPSLFQQVEQSQRQWRSYNESMPQNCYGSDAGLYPADHNPALDYTPLASSCPLRDVPLGDTSTGALAKDLANGSLPAFAFVVPNSCDSSETCTIADGDAWLSTWVPLIVGSPTYRAGKTAVFVVWDEGNKGTNGEDCLSNTKDTSCQVALLALSPYTRPGTQSSTFFSHYSLLRTTEELLGLPLLGQAAAKSTQSMRSAFGL